MLVNVGEGVTVQGGVGGISENGSDGAASVGIAGNIGTNDGVILPYALTDAMVGEIATQPFTGDEVTPDLVVHDEARDWTLVRGTDYVLTWADNIKPGTASVNVTGKGNYLGEVVQRDR